MNGTARDAALSSYPPNAERVAPVMSRILTSAVLEQFARERANTGEEQPNERSGEAPRSAAKTAPMNAAAQASEVTADEPDTSQDAVADSMPLWKRAFDCFAIALAAPLWLPVMLIIMLGIKLSSPGPICGIL